MFLGSRISCKGSDWNGVIALLVMMALFAGLLAFASFSEHSEWERIAHLPPAEKQQFIDGHAMAVSAKPGDFIVTSGGVLLLVRDAFAAVDGHVTPLRVVNCATGFFGELWLTPRNMQKIIGLIPGHDSKEDPVGLSLCGEQDIQLRNLP